MSKPVPVITGTGKFRPPNTISSKELEEKLDLPGGWINKRTGIQSRPIAEDDTTGSMAVRAGRKALRQGNVSSERVDLTILATSTPDQPLPPTAPKVQDRLNLGGSGFDLAGSCVGFIDALETAGAHLSSGSAEHVLVIGSNHLSYRINWEDPYTACLFADAAGAFLLSSSEVIEDTIPTPELIASHTGSDGSLYGSIEVPAGGSREPFTPEAWEQNRHLMTMHEGRKIFKHAVQRQAEAAGIVLKESGLDTGDVNWLLPHQANRRILESVRKELDMTPDQLLSNIETTGNTSAASIPVLLAEQQRESRFEEGDLVLLTSFGSGLRFGAALLEW